jgi:hypothetical protein
MKPMLDKDFDAVFKSSFEGYEVTPANDSWTKISKKINGKTKQKKFPVFWMVAASIVIVLGIGIGLYTKPTEVIKLHPGGEKEMMANLTQEEKAVIGTVPVVNETIAKSLQKPVKNIAKNSKTVTESKLAKKTAIEIQKPVDEPVETDLELVKNVKPLRAKLATERLLEQEEINKLKASATTDLANNNQNLAEIESITEFPTRRARISSMGDLVNFVVAKVDKREEKIIKMSKTEESDNEITGINLGLFKFRKQD